MDNEKEKTCDKPVKDEFLEEFGQRFKEVRQQLKLLQKDLAAGLEVTGSYLSEIEKGKVNPGFDILKRLYLEYNVNIHFLLDGKGDPILSYEGKEKSMNRMVLSDSDREKLHELLFYIERAPVVRYSVYEFFSTYLFRNKEMIEEDIQRYQEYFFKKFPPKETHRDE